MFLKEIDIVQIQGEVFLFQDNLHLYIVILILRPKIVFLYYLLDFQSDTIYDKDVGVE